jgi:hypothetical protein
MNAKPEVEMVRVGRDKWMSEQDACPAGAV